MRKLLTVVAALAFIGGATVAQADEYVKGGFELSGHVNAGASYAHWGKATGGAALTVSGGGIANSGIATFRGPQAELTPLGAVVTAGHDSLLFFIDEAELDATKSFGENLRARFDLAFGRVASGSGFNGVTLEQAYATANIPVGNGLEFLIGRFDAPIGFEGIERWDNTLFSHSIIFNALRPQELTGFKLYYPFSDMVDWHLYVVNNLRDTIAGDTTIPSFGTRVGFNWGEEGKKSTIGISGASGPEVAQPTDKLDLWSFLGDLDWNVWVTDAFSVGGEGIFRMDNASGTGTDGRYFGGQLNLNYVFNDVWDGTIRYAYAQQRAITTAAATGPLAAGGLVSFTNAGVKTQVHEFTLGGQYHIADGAKIQLEYRLDLVKPSAAGVSRGIAHGGTVNFAYSF